MFNTALITRIDAEARLAAGQVVTAEIIGAITSTPPDHHFTVGCCPRSCDPAAVDEGCLMEITFASRVAGLGVDGWNAAQKGAGDTRFDVHDWNQDLPHLVEPLFGPAEVDAADAVWRIGDAVTDLEHLFRFEQRYWLLPNLLVLATSSERHSLQIHAVTPQRPVRGIRYWPNA